MATHKRSNFLKKSQSKNNQIPGTKTSIQNSQLLVSSGISSFDSIIGGGLPIGSLILFDVDTNETFGKLFLKYFLVEGIVSDQAIHICSKDLMPDCLVNELPKPVKNEIIEIIKEDNKDEKMSIAWRYQNMKLISPVNTEQHYFGHYFDLTLTLDKNVVDNSDISSWFSNEGNLTESFEKSDFGLLLQSIKEKLENEKYLSNSANCKRKILRIGLYQIGSPLWSKSDKYLPIFLYCLRALIRNSFSICMVTIPFHLYEDKSLKSKCIHLSDMCFQLESFSGTALEESPAFRDYNGFFRILKLAAINSLVTNFPQMIDLAIKLRRKKLVIEKLHLPPELEDSGEKNEIESSEFGCGPCKQGVLEF